AVLTGAVGVQPAHAELHSNTLPATLTDNGQDGETNDDAAESVLPENMLTWSIAPSLQDADEGDAGSDEDEDAQERVSFRFEVEPGKSVEDEVVVTNFSEEDLTFDLITSDGIVTDEGLFDLLPDPAASEDSGTWIAIDEQVTVPAQTPRRHRHRQRPMRPHAEPSSVGRLGHVDGNRRTSHRARWRFSHRTVHPHGPGRRPTR